MSPRHPLNSEDNLFTCLVENTGDTKADEKKCNHSAVEPVEQENCKKSCCGESPEPEKAFADFFFFTTKHIESNLLIRLMHIRATILMSMKSAFCDSEERRDEDLEVSGSTRRAVS